MDSAFWKHYSTLNLFVKVTLSWVIEKRNYVILDFGDSEVVFVSFICMTHIPFRRQINIGTWHVLFLELYKTKLNVYAYHWHSPYILFNKLEENGRIIWKTFLVKHHIGIYLYIYKLKHALSNFLPHHTWQFHTWLFVI